MTTEMPQPSQRARKEPVRELVQHDSAEKLLGRGGTIATVGTGRPREPALFCRSPERSRRGFGSAAPRDPRGL